MPRSRGRASHATATSPARRAQTVTVLKASAPALLVAIAALAPFHDKAFTIDDTLFLRMAEHAVRDPLRPTDFSYTWFDQPEPMSRLIASGPVGAYLLVPTVLAGGVEWVGHLSWWLLLAVAILATVSLALRLGLSSRDAVLAGALVVASPTVLAMASTNMPDVPALALATLGVERLYAWKQESGWHQAALAALALALAPLARPHTLLIWPLGVLLVGRRAFFPLLAVPLLCWAGLQLTTDTAQSGGLQAAIRRFSQWDGRNAVAWSGHFALTLPLVLPWIALRHRRISGWSLAAGALAAGLAWQQLARPGPPHAYTLVPLSGLSAVVLVDVGLDALRRRDPARGALFAWLLMALPTVVYLHAAAKYLVPSAPAAALLLVLVARESPSRWTSGVLGLAVAAGLAFGLMIVKADARFAGLGRTAASELIGPRVRNGERVWFAGHWGFQWYAERAGGRILTVTPPYPQPGDTLVSASRIHGGDLVNLVARRRLVDVLVDDRPGGRVMSSGAGFFSNDWGDLPWAWGSDSVERFSVWRVE